MSAKDRVAAFAHSGDVSQLVGQAETEKAVDNRHELAHPDRLDSTVDLAGLVSDANAHGVSASVTGIIFQGGEYFLVVGASVFPVNDLRFQGVLSGGDVGEIAYVLKYLRKACANLVPVEG